MIIQIYYYYLKLESVNLASYLQRKLIVNILNLLIFTILLFDKPKNLILVSIELFYNILI